MNQIRQITLVAALLILLCLATSCGSEEGDGAVSTPTLAPTSTPKSSILDAAMSAVGEVGESIGAAVEQAAESAQGALGEASEAAQTTVSQAGDVIDAAGTIVVDQGGEAVEVVITAGQSASEAIQERFSSLKPDEEGNFSVIINESEINQIIKIQELFTDPIPGNPLRNTEVSFQEGVIVFTADVYEPLVGKLSVRFSPYVEQGKVRFEVVDASLGGAETPESTLDAAAESLSSTIGEAMSYLPTGLRPREIIVSNGVFRINGGGVEAGE